jgi:adenine phosphoribosyltransferase
MLLTDKLKSKIRDVKDFPIPGIIFKDITPVFNHPELVEEIVQALVKPFADRKIDAIVAIEARGFIFGSLMAHALSCRFVPVRKAGKLPYKTKRVEYSLEYGTATIEMHEDAVWPRWNVVVHDDLLATGGTAGAAARLVKDLGATLSGFSFLINLSFLPGAQNLSRDFGVNPYYIVEY